MDYVKYDFGFMFKYSERPGTLAAKKFDDNVPEDVKQRRLSEIIDLQLNHSYQNLFKYRGKNVSVLIEKESKKSANHWCGRNPQNLMESSEIHRIIWNPQNPMESYEDSKK